MAECCHPIPGDDVLGYVDENDRIIIHKRQCPVAAKLKSSYGNRILATEWDTPQRTVIPRIYIYKRYRQHGTVKRSDAGYLQAA